MNFKDVYKEANDELCGSGALLDKILSAPVKKPFRIPTVVPVIAVAAMIAVIVAVPKLSERSLKGALKTDVVSDNTPVVVAEAVGCRVDEYDVKIAVKFPVLITIV